jgi:hypothetical protein
VVPRVNVLVTQKPLPAASTDEAASNPPASVKTACLTCHQEDVIRQQKLTRAQWDREINKMTGWGAPVKPEDRPGILDYLAGRYPADR